MATLRGEIADEIRDGTETLAQDGLAYRAN